MLVVDRAHQVGVAVLRIAVGVIFLWAGLEKVLGAGPEGWSAAGFLQFGTGGSLGWPFVSGEVAEGTVFNPTQGIWVGIAGNDAAMSIINFLVPWGQIGIGVGLILGLLTRFSAAMGTLMMLFFFVAAVTFSAIDWAMACSSDCSSGSGTVGSSSRAACRIAGASRIGSRAVRTIR